MFKYISINAKGDRIEQEFLTLVQAMLEAYNDYYYYNSRPKTIIDPNGAYHNLCRMKAYWSDYYSENYLM